MNVDLNFLGGGSSHHPVDNRDHRVGSTKRNHHADDDLISIELGLRLSQRFLPHSAVAVRCGNSQVELPQLVPIADSWMREWSGVVHYVSANTAMLEILPARVQDGIGGQSIYGKSDL
jgi:hypothetical protein